MRTGIAHRFAEGGADPFVFMRRPDKGQDIPRLEPLVGKSHPVDAVTGEPAKGNLPVVFSHQIAQPRTGAVSGIHPHCSLAKFLVPRVLTEIPRKLSGSQGEKHRPHTDCQRVGNGVCHDRGRGAPVIPQPPQGFRHACQGRSVCQSAGKEACRLGFPQPEAGDGGDNHCRAQPGHGCQVCLDATTLERSDKGRP